MFFNKEGYPYNFVYDPSGNTWSGKIFFDENSSDTFRTLCIYTFEDVKSYNFEDIFDLRESQLFNYSGMTFVAKSFENETITKITKVNSSDKFYSKWIFGTDFDKKFLIGQVVGFNNVVGTGVGNLDFVPSGTTYFNVLGSRKNAILVQTKTDNSTFDFTYFSGGTLSSYNIIKVPDYGNQKLVDINNLNYYKEKKLTVFNSTTNDGVYTYNNYEILRNRTFDFILSGVTPQVTGSTLTMEIELFTQRPELYEGDVKITYNNSSYTGTTIEFVNGINTNIDFTSTGQTIIFEDVNGNYIDPNNPTFTITGYYDKQTLTTDFCSFYTLNGLNYIEIASGFTGYTYNDNIKFTAIPNLSGYTFHNNRTFKILDILGNRLNVDGYIITESGYSYQIDKVLNSRKIKKLYASQGAVSTPDYWSGYTVCFSTTNKINISQEILNSGNTTYFYENTITALRNKYRNMFNRYGFDAYHWHSDQNYLIFDGLDWNWNQYFSCSAKIDGIPLNVGHTLDYYSGTTTGVTDVFYFGVDEQLTNEKIQLFETSKLARNFKNTILFDLQRDSLNFGINLTIDQDDYYVPMSKYSTTSTTNLTIQTGTTSFTGGTGLSYESSNFTGQTIIISYDDTNFMIGDITSYDSLNGKFVVNITSTSGSGNYSSWFVNLVGIPAGTSGNFTIDTINGFINKYYVMFDKKGITLSSGSTTSGYTLTLEGQFPNVEIVNLEVKVNSYSTYRMVENITNHTLVISGNELYLVTGSTYNYELTTGMIISVSGTSHTLNNKQYNILRLTENTIQLSYQGPFFYEYNKLLHISINEFLRKPRGTYNKDVYYRMSWNDPYDNSIFFYDYSGDQLASNGNLTYTGPKPLFNSDYTNLVFLKSEPNTNPEEISNPEYQQTIFDELLYPLEEYNSNNFYDYHPVPLEIFLGFNSPDEGVVIDTMKIEQVEYTTFSGTTSTTNNFLISGNTIKYITTNPFFDFQNFAIYKYDSEDNPQTYGFEIGQNISMDFYEITITGETLCDNYEIYKIIDISRNVITLDTNISYFDTSLSGKTYEFVLKVEPSLIVTIQLYGQTEVEDERFEQHLKLLGADFGIDSYPIFDETDIQDAGIDFTILNRKRKELLSVYPEIYNYIGSYKALINAIHYFGFDNLELYEYYRNIKKTSPLFGKLNKILIQDIFDRNVPGWTSNEPSSLNYKKTNLFNLQYRITDFDGTYVNLYSLDEVQIKLTGLVKWLRKNIIPLSANIMDLTGIAEVGTTMYMNYNSATYLKKVSVTQQVNAINFDYIQTLNTGTDYLMTVNFRMITGCTMLDYWTAKIKTFKLNETTNELEPVQYHELYKRDLLSYSFNVDISVDPYMYIETQSYNDYGLGFVNNKLFKYNEGKAFMLVNSNFNSLDYKYFTTDYGYYIIDSGRFYIIKF